MLWNELTILWNELTFLWNEITFLWNEVTWNDLTMERNDRIPFQLVCHFDRSPLLSGQFTENNFIMYHVSHSTRC